MIYALRYRRIDYGSGLGIEFHRFFVVAAFDNRVEFLDGGFNFGFVILINGILLRVYKNTLFSGFDVRHFIFSFDEFVLYSTPILSQKKRFDKNIERFFVNNIIYFSKFGVRYVG